MQVSRAALILNLKGCCVIISYNVYAYLLFCVWYILVQMMFYCGEVGKPPKNPTKLHDCFMSWLSKLSTHLEPPGAEIAVIIIDNADLIMVCIPV